jgi:hypothetical protein
MSTEVFRFVTAHPPQEVASLTAAVATTTDLGIHATPFADSLRAMRLSGSRTAMIEAATAFVRCAAHLSPCDAARTVTTIAMSTRGRAGCHGASAMGEQRASGLRRLCGREWLCTSAARAGRPPTDRRRPGSTDASQAVQLGADALTQFGLGRPVGDPVRFCGDLAGRDTREVDHSVPLPVVVQPARPAPRPLRPDRYGRVTRWLRRPDEARFRR